MTNCSFLPIYFRFINTFIAGPIPEQPLLFFRDFFSFFLIWLKFRELDGLVSLDIIRPTYDLPIEHTSILWILSPVV